MHHRSHSCSTWFPNGNRPVVPVFFAVLFTLGHTKVATKNMRRHGDNLVEVEAAETDLIILDGLKHSSDLFRITGYS
jgi:hypothetical protein